MRKWGEAPSIRTWNKQKNQYTVNTKAKKEAVEKFADAHDFCLHLFTDVPQWHIDPPKAETEKKEFDVKVWAARQYKAQPDHLDAMIKELAKYKDKAQLDLVA